MNLQELIAEILDQIRGMWRFRWSAIAIAWVLSLVGWLYAFSIPDVYRASARVFVDTNSLLRPLMQGLTASENTLNEVQLVSKAVLARPNLERVAHETDLDLRAETPDQMEAIVTGLQRTIRVSAGGDNIFSIQYEHSSREKARDVVAAVLDTFVESAQSNQGADTDVTEQALASEIQVHEERLREAEETLARFKQENLGYMPGEHGDYYNKLQIAMDNVARTQAQLRLLTERRDELRRQIEGEEPVLGIMSSMGVGGGPALCSQSGQIQQLEAQLSSLLLEFTDKHPRYVSLQETINALRERCATESATAGPSQVLAFTGEEPLEANPVYQNLKIQLSNVEVELAEARVQLSSQEGEVAQLNRDVDKITQVETELKQLNRDYDVVRARHQELLRRWEDLQAKKRLDPVTDQVQFRPIEPPFAAANPVGPNRSMLLAATLVFALGSGVAAAFALNQVKPVFFTQYGLRKNVDLPVLGAISMVTTPGMAVRQRVATTAWAAACLLLLLSTAAASLFAPQAATLFRSLVGGAA